MAKIIIEIDKQVTIIEVANPKRIHFEQSRQLTYEYDRNGNVATISPHPSICTLTIDSPYSVSYRGEKLRQLKKQRINRSKKAKIKMIAKEYN